MDGLNITFCPLPFISEYEFPALGGAVSDRYCINLGTDLSCCLPCPMTDWLYSENFARTIPVANYVSLASFICNTLLLLTFFVLPEEQSHRHYLSIGLTVSLMMISLAFIIPMGTQPEFCHNAITPNDMYTDMSCAWTGALLEAGAMGIVVWIALRSIWTLLRAVFDFRRHNLFRWLSILLGIGIPALLLAVAMPITGVSYRLHNVCIPNNTSALPTWFAWLVIFSTIASTLQIWTVVFCFWKFALSAFARGVGSSTGYGTGSGMASGIDHSVSGGPPLTPRKKKRVEWSRVQKLLTLQWRMMVLTFIVVNVTIYFGIVFIQQSNADSTRKGHGITANEFEWALCLIRARGEKGECVGIEHGLGISEKRVIGTMILASTIGVLVFLLMLRQSMAVGWYELLSDPRRLRALFLGRRDSNASADFISMGDTTKHVSLTKHLGSEQVAKSTKSKSTTEPSLKSPMSPPESSKGSPLFPPPESSNVSGKGKESLEIEEMPMPVNGVHGENMV